MYDKEMNVIFYSNSSSFVYDANLEIMSNFSLKTVDINDRKLITLLNTPNSTFRS